MSREDKFVGIQASPICFVDEGVDQVLDTLQGRIGINTLLLGTVSWLGLKIGRSIPITTVPTRTAITNNISGSARATIIFR